MGKIDDIFDKIDNGLDKLSVLGKLRDDEGEDEREDERQVWKWRCVTTHMAYGHPTTGKEIVKPLYNWHAFRGDVSLCGQISANVNMPTPGKIEQSLGSGLSLACQLCMCLAERSQG